jgi:hypothetical protein
LISSLNLQPIPSPTPSVPHLAHGGDGDHHDDGDRKEIKANAI